MIPRTVHLLTRSVQLGPSNTDLAKHRLKSIFKHEGDLFTGSFAEFAATFPKETDARTIATIRVERMYKAYANLKDPPAGTGASVSYFIDTHIPLIIGNTSALHLAYRNKLTPEFMHHYPATLSNSLGVANDLWSKEGAYSNLRRLLRKGGPFPSSVRYVSSQMMRCLLDKQSKSTIACLLKMNMLGSYFHSTVIADIPTRIKVYTSEPNMLIKVFEETRKCRSSHDYFYATAEYVLGASKLQPSLWSWVVQHKNFQDFDTMVTKATDMMRRGQKPPRVVQILAPRAWTAKASIHGLIPASGTRKKMNMATIQHSNPQQLAEIYKQSVLAPTTVGYTWNAISIVGHNLEGLQNCSTDADQRLFCSKLPLQTKAELQSYCHGQVTKQAVYVGALSTIVATMQMKAATKRSGFSHSYHFVCICCGTWRPKTNAFGNANRGTVGVQITANVDTPWQFRCNLCKQTWGIRKINLIGRFLKIRFRIDGPSQLVTICVKCGFPCANPTFKGILPMCKTCNANKQKTFCYKCGRENKGDFYNFSARQGKTKTFVACPKHKPIMAGLSTVPVELLKKRFKSSKSLYFKSQKQRRK